MVSSSSSSSSSNNSSSSSRCCCCCCRYLLLLWYYYYYYYYYKHWDLLLPFCYVIPAYEWFFVHIWYWIDFTLLALVPFIVVLIGNCVMITCVVRAVHFRYRHEPHPVGSAGSQPSGAAVEGNKGKSVTSSTVMLMVLSIVFLLTTSPNAIYFLKSDDWIAEANDAHSEARLRLAFAVTNIPFLSLFFLFLFLYFFFFFFFFYYYYYYLLLKLDSLSPIFSTTQTMPPTFSCTALPDHVSGEQCTRCSVAARHRKVVPQKP